MNEECFFKVMLYLIVFLVYFSFYLVTNNSKYLIDCIFVIIMSIVTEMIFYMCYSLYKRLKK